MAEDLVGEEELKRMDKLFEAFEKWDKWIRQKAKWSREDWRKFLFGGVTFMFIYLLALHFWNWFILMVSLGLL